MIPLPPCDHDECPKTGCAKPGSVQPDCSAASEFDESDFDDDCCSMCGGDGVVALSDCGPSEWGEDCFCEEDRLVSCPECRERERYEAAMRKRQNDNKLSDSEPMARRVPGHNTEEKP